jgi:hypothetical protein
LKAHRNKAISKGNIVELINKIGYCENDNLTPETNIYIIFKGKFALKQPDIK